MKDNTVFTDQLKGLTRLKGIIRLALLGLGGIVIYSTAFAGGGSDCGIRVHHCMTGVATQIKARIYDYDDGDHAWARKNKNIRINKWRRLACNTNKCDLRINYPSGIGSPDAEEWENNTCESDYTVTGYHDGNLNRLKNFSVSVGRNCATTKQ